jgi:hypothetical protein
MFIGMTIVEVDRVYMMIAVLQKLVKGEVVFALLVVVEKNVVQMVVEMFVEFVLEDGVALLEHVWVVEMETAIMVKPVRVVPLIVEVVVEMV